MVSRTLSKFKYKLSGAAEKLEKLEIFDKQDLKNYFTSKLINEEDFKDIFSISVFGKTKDVFVNQQGL